MRVQGTQEKSAREIIHKIIRYASSQGLNSAGRVFPKKLINKNNYINIYIFVLFPHSILFTDKERSQIG